MELLKRQVGVSGCGGRLRCDQISALLSILIVGYVCDGQDFEALTPNLLARTIETVEGGGLVIMLLSTMTSLTQLYSLTMDVHSRFRTESHSDVTRARLSPVPLSVGFAHSRIPQG